MREYQLIALVLAALLRESGKTRLRVTERQFKTISGRSRVKEGLVSNVRGWLEDYGATMFALDRGGFALVSISALDGAPLARIGALLPNWKTMTISDLEKLIGFDDDDHAVDTDDEE